MGKIKGEKEVGEKEWKKEREKQQWVLAFTEIIYTSGV